MLAASGRRVSFIELRGPTPTPTKLAQEQKDYRHKTRAKQKKKTIQEPPPPPSPPLRTKAEVCADVDFEAIDNHVFKV